MDSSNRPNPYAPPEGVVVLQPDEADESLDVKRRSWQASIALWTLVCTISAVPSFVWGLGSIASNQAVAMVLGVAIFIVGYVIADQATQTHAWRRNRSLRLALKIGYITRLAVSVIFPVGGVLDMICGLFSVSAIEFLFSNRMTDSPSTVMGMASFSQVLATTLVQGVVLNVVLSAYMLLVFGIILMIHRGAK